MGKQKGAYTVEAVIVMSTVIFIIFAIISAFLLLYQNAVMYYVATQAAQEGAVMWADTSHDLEGHTRGKDEQSTYYRVGELVAGGGGSAGKTEYISSWVKQKMKKMIPNTLVGSGAEEVNVTFHNYVVQRVVEVRITKEINIPFREIAQYFGRDLDMTVDVKASVAEPAEFVRNVDYGFEVAAKLWGLVSDKLGTLLKSK